MQKAKLRGGALLAQSLKDKYNIEFITLRKELNGNEFLQKLAFSNVKFLQITSTLKV
ncbi:hypothetical protein N9T59_01535 [Paracoccaceae bacterium]|nr:hypothetical protein [Paracoccaceae bacterium]